MIGKQERMAELPDLTVFAQILNRKFKGKLLDQVEVTVAKKLNVTVTALKTALDGRALNHVSREGKTLQFHFSGGQVLGLHLMLRGELVDLAGNQPPRFRILAFYFRNGEGFAVIDLQKQATPTLQPKANAVPDALKLSPDYFTALLAKKRTVIKTLLMDQKAMRGIGNSYADEILYHAGVSPFSVARAIPAKSVTRIFESLHTVLKKAIKDIGEANGDELKGELKDFMVIHNPRLKTTVKGETIKTEKIGGRTTYYTDAQELFS
jgi:formamidopyrimidine-DNA glycosylase